MCLGVKEIAGGRATVVAAVGDWLHPQGGTAGQTSCSWLSSIPTNPM